MIQTQSKLLFDIDVNKLKMMHFLCKNDELLLIKNTIKLNFRYNF